MGAMNGAISEPQRDEADDNEAQNDQGRSPEKAAITTHKEYFGAVLMPWKAAIVQWRSLADSISIHSSKRASVRLPRTVVTVAFEQLMSVLLSQTRLSAEDADALAWYQRHLNSKIGASWNSLLRPCLMAAGTSGTTPSEGDLVLAYGILATTATELIETQRVSLRSIIRANDGLLDTPDDVSKDVARQLIFSVVGWLTMLYDPVPTPAPGQFEIQKPVSEARSRVTPNSRTFVHYSIPIQDVEQPLCLFLQNFGSLIPAASMPPIRGGEAVSVGFVRFAMLNKVVGVKLEWVNTIQSHLEFDHTRKVLKLFRFPSFARMLYRDHNVLSVLYNNHNAVPHQNRPQIISQEHAREILLSYRLIFGQEKKSWQLFRKSIHGFPSHWDCSDDKTQDSDPLLYSLCAMSYKSSPSVELYDEIDGGEISPYYYAGTDFIFLGDKLLALQEYAKSRGPYNWRSLWYDRSNVGFWWTFWAVLFIGGGSLFLAALALAFQIWGSVSSQRQANSSGLPK